MRKYDYNSIVEQLTNIIKEKDTWKDMYESSTGKTLIELIAYATDNIGYYLERRIQELYLHTAKLPSSIYHLASLLDYLPIRKTAASGKMKIILKEPLASNLNIPQGLHINIDNYYYTIIENGIIPVGDLEIELDALQGIFKDYEYVLTPGLEIKFIDLSDVFTGISENYLKVYVPGIETQEYTYSTIPRPTWRTERYFGLRYYFNKLRIDFASIGFGRNPSEDGELLKIQYVLTDGEKGNTVGTQPGFHFEEVLYDQNNKEVTVNDYSIELQAMTGGLDEETIESVQLYAPRIYSTGKRAITKYDYKYWLEKHTAVMLAAAWGEQEWIESGGMGPGETPLDLRNTANISMVGEGFEALSPAEIEDVVNYIQQYSTLTVYIVYHSPIFHNIDLNISIVLSKGFNLSTVANNIMATLNNFGQEYFDFNKSMYLSDFIRETALIEGVEGLELTWKINGESYIPVYYDPKGFNNICKLGDININLLT